MNNPFPIVDSQIHLWTQQEAPPHHWRTPFTISDAIAAMDEAGIDRAINHPAIWDPQANDYAVEAFEAYPDRFRTLGWFPLDESASEATIDEWMAKPGMLGLRFMLGMPDLWNKFDSGELDWIFQAASKRELPVGLMLPHASIPRIGIVAQANPGTRILIDHLNVSPFQTLPDAMDHRGELVKLSELPNIAIKATAVPSMSNEPYPFGDTSEHLKVLFEAFGPKRFFWGSDYTRMRCSWQECKTMFTEELDWLSGEDLALVMGGGVLDWLNWH